MKRTFSFRTEYCSWFLFLFSIGQPLPISENYNSSRHELTKAHLFDVNTVCIYDDVTYYAGENFTTSNPCQNCICNPPGYTCVHKTCDPKPGCKAIQTANKCCPEYLCECEKDGKLYSNGEKVEEPNPCKVCYCKGGEIKCAFIRCYHRSDCEPIYVPGICCPKYDHCPVLDTLKYKSTTYKPDNVSTSDSVTSSVSELPSEEEYSQYDQVDESTTTSDVPETESTKKTEDETTAESGRRSQSVATLEIIEIYPTAAVYAQDYRFGFSRFGDNASLSKKNTGDEDELLKTFILNDQKENFLKNKMNDEHYGLWEPLGLGQYKKNRRNEPPFDVSEMTSHEVENSLNETTVPWKSVKEYSNEPDKTTPTNDKDVGEANSLSLEINRTSESLLESSVQKPLDIFENETEFENETSTQKISPKEEGSFAGSDVPEEPPTASGDLLENPEQGSWNGSTKFQNFSVKISGNAEEREKVPPPQAKAERILNVEKVENHVLHETNYSKDDVFAVEVSTREQEQDAETLSTPDSQEGNQLNSSDCRKNESNCSHEKSEAQSAALKRNVNNTNIGRSEIVPTEPFENETMFEVPSNADVGVEETIGNQSDVRKTKMQRWKSGKEENLVPGVIMISGDQIQYLQVGDQPPLYFPSPESTSSKESKIKGKGIVISPKTSPAVLEMVKVVNAENVTEVN